MTSKPGDLFTLDPDAIDEPFGFDWTAWLAEISDAEVIADSQWFVSGKDDALAASGGSIVTGQKQTQIKLNGGTAGLRYTVTNRITTSSGIHQDRSFKVLIQDQ